MISNISSDNKEISDRKEDTILNLFYESQTGENTKKVESLIRRDNIDTAKQLISNNYSLSVLNNSQRVIMVNILTSDKNNGQKYIKKIIDIADDELIIEIAKDKEIYHHLNRENKNIINSKLNKNPWISVNEIIPL